MGLTYCAGFSIGGRRVAGLPGLFFLSDWLAVVRGE